MHYSHTRFTLVIRRHRSTVFTDTVSPCVHVYTVQEKGNRSRPASYMHLARIYTAQAVCRTLETCTRARATSVTARGAERFRARLVPSRGFLIEPVQKVLSRMQRRARKKRRLQGARMPPGHPVVSNIFFLCFRQTTAEGIGWRKQRGKSLLITKKFDLILLLNAIVTLELIE